MTVWTAHSPPPGRPRPFRLLREGFSLGAFLLGPFWLLGAGAWIAACLLLAWDVLAAALLPVALARAVSLATALLVGFHARDLVRWELARRGYTLARVLAARSEPGAWIRLFEERPDLREAAAKRA